MSAGHDNLIRLVLTNFHGDKPLTKPIARPDRGLFIRIDPHILRPGQSYPFYIYLEKTKTGKTAAIEPNRPLSSARLRDWLDRGVDLFILRREQESYRNFLQRTIERAVRQPNPGVEACRMALELTSQVMRQLFEEVSLEAIQGAEKAVRATTDLIMSSNQAMSTLIALAKHDPYTYTHSCNVGLFGLALAKQLIKQGASFDIHALSAAFYFHDIGKATVGLDVLNKPGPLDEREWSAMRGHPEAGLKILRTHDVLTEEGRYVVSQHHEHLDGYGYPKGMKGEEIHLFARICCIADVYDALTSDRPYRPKMSPLEAIGVMHQKMEGQFDPALMRTFLELFKEMASAQPAG